MARYIDTKNGSVTDRWKMKSNAVQVGKLHPNLIAYFNTLPEHLQRQIVVTSGHEKNNVHSRKSRHYDNRAVDFGWNQALWDYTWKDPNRIKYKITLVDPNHGTAKHFHFSYGQGSENKKDVWVDVWSDKGRQILNGEQVGDLSANKEVTNTDNGGVTTSTSTNTIIPQMDTSHLDSLMEEYRLQREEYEKKMEENDRVKSELEAKQNYVKQKRLEQDNILSMIQGHSLDNVSRRKNNVQFAEGGEFDGYEGVLNSNIQMLRNGLAQQEGMIELEKSKYDNSSYTKVLDRLDRDYQMMLMQKMNFMRQQPVVINNTTTTTPVASNENPNSETVVSETAVSDTKPPQQTDFGKVGDLDLNKVLATIRKRESNNSYSLQSKSSSASGAYQFIDSTWKTVSAKAGYGGKYARAKDAPKEVQDAVALWYVKDILTKNGNNLQALTNTWYTGNAQGKMSQKALSVNKGLTPAKYYAGWLKAYQSM